MNIDEPATKPSKTPIGNTLVGCSALLLILFLFSSFTVMSGSIGWLLLGWAGAIVIGLLSGAIALMVVKRPTAASSQLKATGASAAMILVGVTFVVLGYKHQNPQLGSIFGTPKPGTPEQVKTQVSEHAAVPGPCDKSKLQSLASAVAQDMANHNDAGLDAQEGVGAEEDCINALSAGDARDQHTLSAAEFYLDGAVYGANMFGLKKSRLEGAKQLLQQLLGEPSVSEATRLKAQDMMESVTEKLAALGQ